MGNGKLLSIIIPAYNVEDYIEQCLDSIFDGMSEETAKLTEVIVVNDGSTDGTGEILKNYRRNNIPLLVIEKVNGGVSSARNKGIKIANGKYLFFVDGDDYVLESGFRDLFKFLLNHDNIDIINFEICLFWDKTGVMEYRKDKFPVTYGTGQDLFVLWEKANVMSNSACTRLFRRNLIIDNKLFFYDGIESEDEEWTPKVFSYANKVVHVHICAYVYRMRESSITHVPLRKRCFTDLVNIIDSLIMFSSSSHLSSEFRKTLLGVISYIYWRLFRGMKIEGQFDEELISEIEKRLYLMDYSTNFHRKYIYRPFIKIFGVRAYYALKFRNEYIYKS